MKAGTKLVSMETAVKRSGEVLVISSDAGAELAVGSAAAEVGPVLIKVGGATSVRVTSAGEPSETRLDIAPGRRVAFLESGFSALGRTMGEADAGPKSTLKLKCIPRGYTVYANGQKVGVTPLGQVMVPAGSVTLRFERPGEKPKARTVNAMLHRETTVVWGEGRDFPIKLERRTIPLMDETGAWEGVDPILEGKFVHGFGPLSDPEYAINRVFMCKDDKYLYWRMDFAGANPFAKTPKGVGREIVTQLTVLFDFNKEFNIGLYKNTAQGKTDSFQGNLSRPEVDAERRPRHRL